MLNNVYFVYSITPHKTFGITLQLFIVHPENGWLLATKRSARIESIMTRSTLKSMIVFDITFV